MSEQSSVCLENPAMFFIVSWCGSGRQVRNKIQPPERTHHTQSRPAQSRRAGWCSTFLGSVEHNCRSNSRGPWFCGKPTDIGPKSIAYSQHVTTRGWPCCRNIFQWEPWISNGFHPGHFIMMIFQSSSFPIGWLQVLQLYQLAPQRKHAEKSDEMWWVRVAAAYLCGYFCTQMFQEPMFLVKFLKQSLPRFIINLPHMILSSHVFFGGAWGKVWWHACPSYLPLGQIAIISSDLIENTVCLAVYGLVWREGTPRSPVYHHAISPFGLPFKGISHFWRIFGQSQTSQERLLSGGRS